MTSTTMKEVATIRGDKVSITWRGYLALATFMLTLIVTTTGVFATFLNLKITSELGRYSQEGLPARNNLAIRTVELRQAENSVKIESLVNSIGTLSVDLKDLAKSIRDSNLVHN